MAIAKVCGIETEYGILVRGAESNPVTASSLLINSYLGTVSRRVGWDFEDEHPGTDARGFRVDDLLAPEVETGLVNAVLRNQRAMEVWVMLIVALTAMGFFTHIAGA